MKKPEPKTKVAHFDIDPCAGAARMALSTVPEGYTFVSLVRKGTKAKVTYRKIKP